jgi:hypothetical protein
VNAIGPGLPPISRRPATGSKTTLKYASRNTNGPWARCASAPTLFWSSASWVSERGAVAFRSCEVRSMRMISFGLLVLAWR